MPAASPTPERLPGRAHLPVEDHLLAREHGLVGHVAGAADRREGGGGAALLDADDRLPVNLDGLDGWLDGLDGRTDDWMDDWMYNPEP